VRSIPVQKVIEFTLIRYLATIGLSVEGLRLFKIVSIPNSSKISRLSTDLKRDKDS
jgi:hypothetical protein